MHLQHQDGTWLWWENAEPRAAKRESFVGFAVSQVCWSRNLSVVVMAGELPGMVFEKEEQNIGLDQLSDGFAMYRISDPRTEQEIKVSMSRDGQLAPIVVCREGSVFNVLDGFKRFRAAKSLPHITHLKAKIIRGENGYGRAAMLRLNQERKGLCMVEEAMIVHAMHYEEGLPQTTVAHLVNHHPTWVCRRIAMMERLHEEVIKQMKLGLVSGAMGRHIKKLPRGNQLDLLKAIQSHRLSCREAADLVANLSSRDNLTKQAIEAEAKAIVQQRKKTETVIKTGANKGQGSLQGMLTHFRRVCLDILAWSEKNDLGLSLAMPSTLVCAEDACEVGVRVLNLLRSKEILS